MELDYYALNAPQRALYKARKSVFGISHTFIGFFKKLFNAVKKLFTSLFSKSKDYILGFIRGNSVTRLSYLVMGFGHFTRRQTVKGILYLFVQVLFVLFTFFFSHDYLAMLFENILSGGNIGRKETYISDIWDEAAGEYPKLAGDNSFHIVLYGILSIFVTLLFLYLYFRSVKESIVLEQYKTIGKAPSGFGHEIEELSNDRFHIPLLSFPLLGLFLFTVVPLICMILIAFTNYDADHEVPEHLFQWVGFENFKIMLFGTSSLGATFRRVLLWTLVWAFFATFTNYFFGMLLALLINKKNIKFKRLYRTLLVSAIAVPQFVSLLIMSKMLDTGGGAIGSGGGIITQFIERIFGYHLKFGLDITTTRISIIIVNMWLGIPYSMLICTGILMNIPSDLYESARIDGASAYRRFAKITLPYMLFVTAPYLITQFIGNINNFNVIYLLSGGNPGDISKYTDGAKGTDLLITWLYKLSLGADRNYKLASVIGILVFIISSVFSLIVYNNSSSVRGEETFQ